MNNLVFEEMVKKLNLERRKHPKTYRRAWVQDTQKLLVSEQCNVKFKVGNYSGEILCDIIPMDACHIFLGRPWKYDQKPIHDGCANTYTIVKDGVKHKLKPLKEENVQVFGNARVCLVDARIFLEGMKHEKFFFSIIPKVTNEVVDEVLVEVVDFLQEFKMIVSDNVPEGLPPMRKISHQIDLILGESFPNKASYRMSPTETEEVNRQVVDLLKKGLIRESLNPCVMLVALSPKKGG